ncbi:MAG TPA: OmcA/MtrC family decaheme c-type cytochrome [Anaeromyxobacter sp.]
MGAPALSGAGVGGPKIEIAGARVDAGGHVVVTLRITRGGIPVATVAEASALRPQFTVAGLSTHPADGLDAWTSFLPTGRQTIPSLPPGGPGTPAASALANARQPGSEASGTLAGADGAFTYTYANALPARCPAPPNPLPADRQCFDPARTLRVGAWLLGNGTADGTSTFDLAPTAGGAAARDVALYQNCQGCHAVVVSHDGAVGVKICTTCHTWQNADPDTVDPAALDGATAATDPNPLELGRLVHRIHRGKKLPTLYAAAAGGTSVPAPTLPSSAALPLPYFPGRNAAVLGRKYSVVGAASREIEFGAIVARTENQLAPRTVAVGVAFPRDLRDCGVCHRGAPQASETLYAVSRRTCSGCHPEAWFQSAAITDAVHFAHPGGPQADDLGCRGCHVAATAAHPKVYAPIADIHVEPQHSPYFDRPKLEIVSVANVRPGAPTGPTIRFKLHDRLGDITPIGAAVPAYDTTSPFASPVMRSLAYPNGFMSITVNGPTAPAYGYTPLLSEAAPNPSIYALAPDAIDPRDGLGIFTYQFASKLPADASGTWAVGIDARRRVASTTLYDPAADAFRWPYTGEAVSEPPLNPLVYVDTSTGTYTAGVPDAAVPRRRVVAQAKCERCHDPIEVHGTVRARVEYCLVCHAPSATDRGQRPGVAYVSNGNTNLAATLDGIEERSIEYKVLVHRIHTGGRTGAASLEALAPFVVYGRYGSFFFFDEGIFPGALANCTTCHEGRTYEIDAVPEDAPPTIANETGTVLHQGTAAHVAGEPAVPPIQSACLGCHANGFTPAHAAAHTANGIEQCAQCHARGPYSVDVVHGLASPGAALVSTSFSSIVQNVIVPRCASAACHGGNPPAAFPRLDADAARDAIVNVPSQQASALALVKPNDPANSYFLLKIRGDAASVGGVATRMPIGDAALEPSEIAAIEGWIANGAPND